MRRRGEREKFAGGRTPRGGDRGLFAGRSAAMGWGFEVARGANFSEHILRGKGCFCWRRLRHDRLVHDAPRLVLATVKTRRAEVDCDDETTRGRAAAALNESSVIDVLTARIAEAAQSEEGFTEKFGGANGNCYRSAASSSLVNLSATLRRAAKWASTMHVRERRNVADEFVYEMYVYTDILLRLSSNYRIRFVPGSGATAHAHELSEFARFIEVLDLAGKTYPISVDASGALDAHALITNGKESTECDAERRRKEVRESSSFYSGFTSQRHP